MRSLSLPLFLNWFIVCIWLVRVEGFVGPHQGDQGLGVREVDDVVGVAGEHLDCLDLLSGDFEVEDLVGADLAFLDERFAADDDEELPFGVVPVLSFGDAGI